MNIAVPLILATLVTGGAGAAQGYYLTDFLRAHLTKKEADHAAIVAHTPEKPANLREMKPVITNLSAPAGAWIRLEVVLVLQSPFAPNSEPLVAEVMNDMVAYLRTLTAVQLEGASGLRRLREDLTERASLRTERKVSDVLIQTLVVQ